MNTNRTSKIAALLIVVGTMLFFGTVWGVARYYLGRFSLPAELVYGQALPAHIKQLASFRAPEGLAADLYNSTEYTKVGMGFSFEKPAQETAVTGEELLRMLKDGAAAAPDPRLTVFVARYLSAQFDARRAYNIAPVEVRVGNAAIQAAQFNSKSEWNHLVGLVNLPHGQFVFQAVRKNTAVDPVTVAEILEREFEASRSWSAQ